MPLTRRVTLGRHLAGVTLALGLIAGLAYAGEKPEIPPDVDTKALKSAQETFRRSFDTIRRR